MSKRDLKNSIATSVAIEPQALSGNTDLTGEIIDTKGYSSLTFVLQTDAIAASTLDAQLLIQEGDAANLSDAAAAADADLIGTEAATAIANSDDKVTKRIGYKGNKRYVRCDLTVTSNNGTDVVGAIAVQGHATNNPTS